MVVVVLVVGMQVRQRTGHAARTVPPKNSFLHIASPTAHMFGSSLAPLQSDGLLVVTVVVVVLVVVTVVVVVVLDVLVVLVVHESHRTGQSFRSASPANGRKH